MSILTRPIGKAKDAAEQQEPDARASKRGKTAPPGLALSPRADLLPPEIGINNRRKSVRRGLRFVIAAVVLVAAAGVGGAWYAQFAAQQSLTSAQGQTQRLSAERAKYAEIAKTISGISTGTAAQHVGGGTEIDWEAYLSGLQATLPAGVTITNVEIDSADAQSAFEQSKIPLENQRIATLTFEATTADLPRIPDWINSLSSLPGYADATPNEVKSGEDGYTTSVTMHIDTDAYSNRFNPDAKKEGDGK